MALQDKYINPFTDFGFKKLVGSEQNKSECVLFRFPYSGAGKEGRLELAIVPCVQGRHTRFTFSEVEA